ncbi:MAG: hypothetical protein A4E52_01042 [Pelotomaculum sp. PtaB.Bin013]|uniref:Uncharacterized protein n=1 Tax=Pelotomaculum isophthalicicum JI TaxID=947010 RepID=A0A9X4H045_9FIRM|nr:hypothetical protein [Pelotomaculum isophthalicicum]MDF9406900.1 hypothetical protein [Pelotomaculum isophthalicicum JI]OPX89319.1 MAG: hypothetical protein A4E52_01042 [Pelotomaculum sp. PtaB.Bin013]
MRYIKTFYPKVLYFILPFITIFILIKYNTPMLAAGVALYLMMGFDDSSNKFLSRFSEKEYTVNITDWMKKEVSHN